MSVDVTNVGKIPGKEVVQLYVADRESTVIRPVRELKGFEKIALEPGETKTVTFTLGKRAFAYWNTEIHDWHVETGAFGIQIARSSRDIELEQDVTVVSTVALPCRYTLNTIFADLMDDPKAMETFKPMRARILILFGSYGAICCGKKENASATRTIRQPMINEGATSQAGSLRRFRGRES